MRRYRAFLILSCYLSLAVIFLRADKDGMPDFNQIDNTCLPSSVSNLLVWFGNNGYPKLVSGEGSLHDKQAHIMRMIMVDTDARYDQGTSTRKVVAGITTYIHQCGYGCQVSWHGVFSKETFSPDWLNENQDPDKGFILLLTYAKFDENQQTILGVFPMGHAVTLVSAQPDLLVIHDPAHAYDENGRKVVSAQVFSHVTEEHHLFGTMIKISGSYLDAPPQCTVLISGALRIQMFPTPQDEPKPKVEVKKPGVTSPSANSLWALILKWLFPQ